MTKLKQIAIVVSEGEFRLHPLLSSTRTMFKKDLSCFVLGLGKVGITKCQYDGVVVGLGCSEVGFVSDVLGWNRLGGLTAMVKVEVIRNIIIVTIARLSIKGTATAMNNIKGATTSKGNIGRFLVPDRCPEDILIRD